VWGAKLVFIKNMLLLSCIKLCQVRLIYPSLLLWMLLQSSLVYPLTTNEFLLLVIIYFWVTTTSHESEHRPCHKLRKLPETSWLKLILLPLYFSSSVPVLLKIKPRWIQNYFLRFPMPSQSSRCFPILTLHTLPLPASMSGRIWEQVNSSWF